MKKIGALGVVVSGLFLAVVSYPTIICGCMDAGFNLAMSIGAHPLKADAATVREKLLAQLPVGSSLDEVRHYIRSISPGAHSVGDPCARTPGLLSCRFVVSKSIWGEDGFEMRIALDAANRLLDAQVARF